MSTSGHQSSPTTHLPAEPAQPALFAGPAPEPSGRGKLIGAAIAVVVVGLIAVALFLRNNHASQTVPPSAILETDPYAQNLIFTELAMSESTSLAGGKSTYIDGHVKNSGPDTVTGVTMQVFFRNDINMPPQVETVPLTLIRTHDPYVDIQPVSAAPLKPGDEAEFRLIFETVTGSWNQQMPELHVVHVAKR